jgi:tetratricopeptide (TPR) repeat protein
MLDARQWTRAETAYHAALEVVPDYVGAYHGLARLVLEGRNDRPAAIATLQRAIVMDPANFHTYLLMGDFVVNEDPSGADRWYRQAESILRATPRPTAETHAQRGIVYARRRQYEAAIEELQTAIRLDPRNASYHITLGDLYRGLQDIERARGEYCRALELDPPNAHAQRQLASLSVASPTPPGEGFHLTLYCP